MKVCVLGAGSWGTALAILMAGQGTQVALWHRREELVQQLKEDRENTKYLPGVELPSGILPTSQLDEAVRDSEVIILAVPSHSIRNICVQIKDFVHADQYVVNVAKGLEEGTHLRLSQVINDELPYNNVFVLTGPSHAEEVAKGLPTTVVISGEERESCECLQDLFTSPAFRVYTNPDMIGVELGGALKNIIALGAGISDGLGYGDNSKAALMTRGIAEISRLGKILGAKTETFAGLAGIGDLIVTCTSMHSRNRRAGILLGEGQRLDQVLDSIGMVVEGVRATKVARELSEKHGVEMPITNGLFKILFEDADPKDVVTEIMTRSNKHEMEEINSLYYYGWN
ncbi:NAD(P)H-dependent glycerol-3-phosphate dehydrogenase [Alkalibacter rhizosphaerae]|uniref:Glycerol-3-phosphate dehydrogenase [NAD(P)+] n=1 Tax=Alkalibacter rhizosphaerae TaxID=2815577 RepID=A0A975AHM0_9FIRM|nr:NAD(P)H-dependent glycerol-3-phosphate dehydrogenase [Alkalibacter rhizosphaerae]QSX08764.1 NAD(P)H-dependent glycerol-3-phosphate dehydrogenase [Alkalibacter rhizosphaerae]